MANSSCFLTSLNKVRPSHYQGDLNAQPRLSGGEENTEAWQRNSKIVMQTDTMCGVFTSARLCAKHITHTVPMTTSHLCNKYLLST